MRKCKIIGTADIHLVVNQSKESIKILNIILNSPKLDIVLDITSSVINATHKNPIVWDKLWNAYMKEVQNEEVRTV